MKINWSKIFDWSISCIQKPYEVRSADKVIAYRVDVMYRYHGLEPFMFPVGDDRVLVSGTDLALSRANRFFDIMSAKMQRNTRKR